MADFPAAHDLVHEVLVIASQVLAPWYVFRLVFLRKWFLTFRSAVGEFECGIVSSRECELNLHSWLNGTLCGVR